IGRVKDYTLKEIKKIDVGASFSEEFRDTTVPTLEEILEACPDDVKLNIEIKNIPVIYHWIEELLINCLQKNGRMHNVVISSFDHVALKRVQEIAPDMELGMLFYSRLPEPWKYAKNSGLYITSIHTYQLYVDREFVDHCKAGGYEVFLFLVNGVG